MAIDAIAIAGVPPPAAGPPDATASGNTAQATDRRFSSVIAEAMDAPAEPGAVVSPAAVEPAPVLPGLDFGGLIALLGSLSGEPGGPALPSVSVDARPDRDAEAEDAAGTLAALMLGATPVPPQVTMPDEGGAAAVAPLAASGAWASTVADMPYGGIESVIAPVARLTAEVPASDLGVAQEGLAIPEGAETATSLAAAVARPSHPTPLAAPATADDASAGVTAASRSSTPAAEALVTAEPAPGADATAALDGPARTSTAAPERVDASEPRSTEHIDAPAQPAGLSVAGTPPRAAEASAAPATQTLDAPNGSALASGLAETVRTAAMQGDHEVRIALNPPDLGHLTVHITEHDSGGVTVSIRASSQEAHDLLQQQLPALRAGLEQREVRVERLQVEQQAASAGLGWADSGQRQSGGQRDAWAPHSDQQWSPIASMGGVRAPARTPALGGRVEDGRVDLRA